MRDSAENPYEIWAKARLGGTDNEIHRGIWGPIRAYTANLDPYAISNKTKHGFGICHTLDPKHQTHLGDFLFRSLH